MYQFVSRLWYELLRGFSYVILVFFFSFRSDGSRHARRKGAFLVIANHQSFFDPICAGVACWPTLLAYLGRRTLFQPPWFGWLISSVQTYPIDQDGLGRDGLMTVVRLLKQGMPVLIFPEGTRSEDGNMSPLKPGLLLILRKCPVPVIPVGIVGAFEAMPYWEKIPKLSPLMLTRQPSAMAASVGPAVDGARLAEMPRAEALAEMQKMLDDVIARAKKIQRKT